MKNQEISMLIGQKRAYNSSSFLLYVSNKESFVDGINDLKYRNGVKKQKKTRNIAILASKKNFKTAVLRNKVRRMIKNAVNKVILDSVLLNNYLLKEKKAQIQSYNLIFSLKKGFENIDFNDLVREVQQSFAKNAII